MGKQTRPDQYKAISRHRATNVVGIAIGFSLLLVISAATAGVFGGHDLGRASPLIDDLYGADPRLAATAAKQLAERGDPDLARYLIDAADLVSPQTRPEVLRALGHFDGREVDLELASWLDHNDVAVRLAAVEAIGKDAQANDQDILESTLTDPDARVRQQALRGLIRIGATSDPTPLIGDLEHDDALVRVSAANMLGEVCSLPQVGRYLDEIDGRGASTCAQALSRQRYDLDPGMERAVARALHRLERAGISTCPDAGGDAGHAANSQPLISTNVPAA